jgi:hypothetical protein
MAGLTLPEIMKVVNRYIGVEGGYLGDFSYRTHADFYLEYCDLDIDPYKYDGTTRERFIQILKTRNSSDQAKILRGVIERFPVEGNGAPRTRTEELQAELESVIARLDSLVVASPSLGVSSAAVDRAISDSESLILTSGSTSAIDRIHTALHGYLRVVCSKAGIKFESNASLTQLCKLILTQHPKLQNLGPRTEDIKRMLQASNTILDAMNPLRNRASIAHPNEELLEEAEASLVINIARSLLQYFDSKLGRIE